MKITPYVFILTNIPISLLAVIVNKNKNIIIHVQEYENCEKSISVEIYSFLFAEMKRWISTESIGKRSYESSWKYKIIGIDSIKIKRVIPAYQPLIPNVFFKVSV